MRNEQRITEFWFGKNDETLRHKHSMRQHDMFEQLN